MWKRSDVRKISSQDVLAFVLSNEAGVDVLELQHLRSTIDISIYMFPISYALVINIVNIC